MAERLAVHTDVSVCLVVRSTPFLGETPAHLLPQVGGLSFKSQEATLAKCHDIIVATPARLIDHLCNAHSFGLDTVEILVLDESDRMLDMGFREQVPCPAPRSQCPCPDWFASSLLGFLSV